MMTIEKRHEEYLQNIKDLRLIDDDFMRVVFKDEECVKYVVQTVLQEDYQHIISSETKYDMKNLHGRSNRIDILAVDIIGRNINVEFQKYKQGASVKRARRHVSLVDVNMSKEKENLDQLKDVMTIFFTIEDELKNGLPISHIERYVTETKEKVNDGTQIIYVPVNIRDGSALDLLKEDLLEKEPERIHSEVLRRRVNYLKKSEEGKDEMCKIFEEIREKGRKENEEKIIKIMLLEGVSIEKIERYTEASIERITDIRNNMIYA